MITLKKISTAIASGAVLLATIVPAASANIVDVANNGAFSRNLVDMRQSNDTTLLQSNDSRINNEVSVGNSTGGNTSSFNTGGNSSIQTGAAVSTVDITNGGNTNIATIPSCGCNQGSDIFVGGNGAFSTNHISENTTRNTFLDQNNTSDFTNRVNVHDTTGNNQSSFNTGGGSTWGNWNPSWSQNEWWNWYWDHQMNKSMDWNQFNNWFTNFHNQMMNGSNQVTTGNAISDVTIHNSGSTNVIH